MLCKIQKTLPAASGGRRPPSAAGGRRRRPEAFSVFYRAIYSYLQQFTAIYSKLQEFTAIYSIFTEHLKKTAKHARAVTRTTPEICQDPVPTHPGTKYPVRGNPSLRYLFFKFHGVMCVHHMPRGRPGTRAKHSRQMWEHFMI